MIVYSGMDKAQHCCHTEDTINLYQMVFQKLQNLFVEKHLMRNQEMASFKLSHLHDATKFNHIWSSSTEPKISTMCHTFL